ncbi:hypothetical protein [Staphylococcus rostri]|uniref:Uncharacterized protein n=2 Tax=Staphylococcus rostri TaxID=522262 RepID=A0A2K3YTX0_9STAP|nr:hypothetical protein [Staphylococcus rostri]PNZ29056.1 hypothetical protein CD122_02690 [Staphylococcus rostri]
MRLKYIKWLYLLTILSSSLFYAFCTTKIIADTQLSPFTVILLSTLIELFIYVDLNYLKKLTQLSTRYVSMIGIGVFFLAQLLFILELNVYVILLLTYVACSLLFNMYLLCLENQIIGLDGNTRNGLISITLLRNLSKIIGFGLGACFQAISIWHYTFILLFTFLILSNVNIKNSECHLAPFLPFKNLNGKALIGLLLCLGSVSVFTIPTLIQDLDERNLTAYSTLPFVLPGMVSVLYLRYFKHTHFNNNVFLKSMTYVGLIVLYLVFRYYDVLIFTRMIIIAVIITLSIAITIDVRTQFIRRNTQVAL